MKAVAVLKLPSPRPRSKSAGDRASYGSRGSTDQESWLSGGTTLQARTVLEGLEPDTRYYFQVRIQLKDAMGSWGDVVSLLVA